MSEEPRPSGSGGLRLAVGHSPAIGVRLAVGASLAVAGVCLTLTEGEAERSVVEVSPETLARTTLGGLRSGDEVNLEPPLRVGDALGGHWVQGHVDGTAALVGRRDLDAHRVLAFALPVELEAFVVLKGSVALDGVSLTVAARAPGRFEVALVPHTLAVTTLSALAPGARANLEVDILAKYVAQAVAVLADGRAPAGPAAASVAPARQ